MNEYKPDVWQVVKFTYEGKEPVYKVLAGWSGGYTQGQAWRLNSGITKIIDENDHFIFEGHTGSKYRCHKKMEQFNNITASIFEFWKNESSDKIAIELIPIEQAIKLINN